MKEDFDFVGNTNHEIATRRRPVAVIVDIDGTIADQQDRYEYACSKEKENSNAWWDLYLSGLVQIDKPYLEAKDFLWKLSEMNVSILYVTGRRSDTISVTAQWLKIHNFPQPKFSHPRVELHQRPKGYRSPFWKVKCIEWIKLGYDVVAGYGDSDGDMEAYGNTGIEAIRIIDGEGWRLPRALSE